MDVNEFNIEKAKLEMDLTKLRMEESNKMLEWMGTVAKTAFTALITINGAAIISLLTFLGNSQFVQRFSGLWFWAISSFCFGLLFIILGIAFAFWSQKIFREGLDLDIKHGKETGYQMKVKDGIVKRIYAISFVLLSLVAFVAGCVFALCALSASF